MSGRGSINFKVVFEEGGKREEREEEGEEDDEENIDHYYCNQEISIPNGGKEKGELGRGLVEVSTGIF